MTDARVVHVCFSLCIDIVQRFYRIIQLLNIPVVHSNRSSFAQVAP